MPHQESAQFGRHTATCPLPCAPRTFAPGLRPSARQRGTVYLVVLAISMLITAIALSAMAVIRLQRQASNNLSDADEARSYAWSGVQLARLWMSQDSAWRTHRSNGVWVTKQAIGSGFFGVSVTDPADSSLSNNPDDSVVVVGTGYKGQAVQMVTMQLDASAQPLDILAYSLSAAGTVHVGSGDQLVSNNSTIISNNTLTNAGVIGASVQCLLAVNLGAITGSTTILSTGKSFPGSTPVTTYTGMGTSFIPPSNIDSVVLGPGINPYGTSDPNGIYILNPSGNLTIKRCRIYGTLIINLGSGKTVTFDRNLFIQPTKPDYAALIINGSAVFQYDSANTNVSESSLGVNFNPPGAPYNGATNNTMIDTYPCEIRGLVHVTGNAVFSSTALVRGVVIVEGTPLLGYGVDFQNSNEIVYDPTIYTHPPIGYQKSTTMVVTPSSRKQQVN